MNQKRWARPKEPVSSRYPNKCTGQNRNGEIEGEVAVEGNGSGGSNRKEEREFTESIETSQTDLHEKSREGSLDYTQ